FLDEVLDRLDVVVGGAFDLFDAGSVGGREAIGQGAEAGGGAFVEGGQLGNAGFGGQGQQPLHFNTHAGVDQPELGEHRPQRLHLAGVAAVEGGEGEQRVEGGHGGLSSCAAGHST